MHSKRIATVSVLAFAALGFSACGVDTTGLSAESARTPAGNPSSGVIVYEYADLQCPACQAANELIKKPLLEKYGKQVRFEFKHFPLKSIHRFAFEAAQASECAADQGKFWEYIDTAYANQSKLSSSALREWAVSLQLDAPLFERCVASGIKADAVNADAAQGMKLGVDSTPTFMVNGARVERNTVEAISQAIDAALKQGAVPL